MPKFNKDTGEFLSKKPENTSSWSSIFSKIVEDYAKDNEKFRVVMPAMTYGSSFVEFEKKYPEKYIDVGICEAFAVCYSTALAMDGIEVYIPIYSSFLQRAYDQVLHDLARQKIKVVLGIDHAGIVGADGETHQGIYDIAYLRHIPNIEIVQPSNMIEAKQLLDYAFKTAKESVAIRYSKGDTQIQDIKDFKRIEKPTWLEYFNNADVNLVAYGDNFHEFKVYIDEHKLPINLYNALFIKPFDMNMVNKIFSSGKLTYVIEDSIKVSGLGSALLEYASENNLDAKLIKIIGLPDEFIEHGDVLSIKKQYKLDLESVIKQILK